MSIKDWNAGIIRPIPVAPAGPYQDGAAPGVWTLDQVAYWQKQGLWPIAGNVLPIGLFGPGDGSGTANTISKIVISTTGNATDFGDLAISGTSGPTRYAAFGSSTRCIWSGGILSGLDTNVISYSTYVSSGNAADFGDLTLARSDVTGFSSSTRGITAGGYAGSAQNILDYVTISSTGNATDFGDSTYTFYSGAGLSSSTRGIFALGYAQALGRTNVIEYVTISTTGNATDFGDTSVSRNQLCGASNSTRGLFAGGNTGVEVNIIDYITIASAGNATDFGDLTQTVARAGAVSSGTRFVRGGGAPPYYSNVLDYVEISTTGNATDFGDLAVGGRSGLAGCSNAHGGL